MGSWGAAGGQLGSSWRAACRCIMGENWQHRGGSAVGRRSFHSVELNGLFGMCRHLTAPAHPTSQHYTTPHSPPTCAQIDPHTREGRWAPAKKKAGGGRGAVSGGGGRGRKHHAPEEGEPDDEFMEEEEF